MAANEISGFPVLTEAPPGILANMAISLQEIALCLKALVEANPAAKQAYDEARGAERAREAARGEV